MSLKLHTASRGRARGQVLVSERHGVGTLTYTAGTQQTRSHVQVGRREQWGGGSSHGHGHGHGKGQVLGALAAWCRRSSGVLGPDVMAGSHSRAAGGRGCRPGLGRPGWAPGLPA